MTRTITLASLLSASLLLCGAPLASAQAPARSAAARADVLFGGKSLDGWKAIGEPRMTLLPDGSVGAERGNGVLYYATRPYGDFTLELEFLPEVPEAGAAVLLRLPQPTATADEAERNAYQVKLGESPVPPGGEPVYYKRATYITGAIDLGGADSVHDRDQMSPHRGVTKPMGEWNTLRVDAVGQRYTVYVNGEKVTDFFGRKATEGYIGLVNHTPDFAVRFRNIRVTPRAASTAPNSLGELFAVHD
jgi:hypothetical protein